MKVLFVVNAVHLWERTGLLTLSSVLKKRGHAVRLYDIRGRSSGRIVGEIRKIDPDLLAYSAMSNEIGSLLRANRLIRSGLRRGIRSVFGGPHATFFPGMIDEPGVDAVCRGEAEESFPLYLEHLEGRRAVNQIPGFLVKDGGPAVVNPLGPRIVDLDCVPFPDRELWDPVDPFPAQKSFFASRGCPYTCAYCFNHKYNEIYGHPRPVVRWRSVGNLVFEIRSVLERYPDVHPFFNDDSFLSAPADWLREFAECYRLEVSRPFGCGIRADEVSEQNARLLAQAGCHYCWLGVECGDEEFANRVMRRHLTNEQIRRAAGLLRSCGIRCATQNINALPSERPLEMDEKTLQLNIKCKPDFAMAHVYYPYPGTEMAVYAAEKGLFDGNYAGLEDAMCLSSPLKFPSRLRKELERQNRLFGFVVAFPWLKGLLPLLRRLPLDRIYTLVHFLNVGYRTRIRMMPRRRSLGYYRSLVRLLIRRMAEGRHNGPEP